MPLSKKARTELGHKLLESGLLNDREKDIFRMRLGFDGAVPSTLQEIGDKYNITRERVRQIGNAISRKIKKNFPEDIYFANHVFSKSWEPKYKTREKYLIRRRAVIKRNKCRIRNKCKELTELINNYKGTKDEKFVIAGFLKNLRIKYRKNKSLFEPDVVIQIKDLRQKWTEVRRQKLIPPKPLDATPQGQTF
jgi:hypothetical protein